MADILRDAGIEAADREARWLVEGVILAEGGDPTAALLDAAKRRAGGEPLQYILGNAHFRHLELAVGPGVFIPRPETELVVERALGLLPYRGVAVDVGTGSGAIALALATERPDAGVYATERDAGALAWARRNNETLGEPLAGLFEGDLFDPLPDGLAGEIDVVVANPPYIAPSEGDRLPRDVVEHEPAAALFAPGGGAAVIDAIADAAPRYLAPGGHLVLEIGAGQGDLVRSLLARHGFRTATIARDLAGNERIATGRSPAEFDQAVDALEAGAVAIVPTDTVYGIAARPETPGVARIFELKGRPPDKALPVLGHDLEALRTVARFDDRASALAAKFWPGPLTIVLPRTSRFAADLGGAADTVAVRIPDHRGLLRLLAATGPLAVTSANRSGEPEAVTAAQAAAVLGEDLARYEGGTGRGRASTVVSLVGPMTVLREGEITGDQLDSY